MVCIACASCFHGLSLYRWSFTSPGMASAFCLFLPTSHTVQLRVSKTKKATIGYQNIKKHYIYRKSEWHLIHIIGCWISGLGFIAVAIAAMICFVLHVMQLNSLKKYLRQPGPHSSKDYHSRPTRVFWPMVSRFYFTNIYILPKRIIRREFSIWLD